MLPSCAAALGLPGFDNALGLPAASRVCVVMVDGLGRSLLTQRAAHTPFLRAKLQEGQGGIPTTLDAAFPSTTASSLASFGTGLPPGQHGMVGYDVLAPHLDRVVNQLGGWDPDVDPDRWQPFPTIFERMAGTIPVATVSLPQFERSAMTRAALRGSRFIGAETLHARSTAAAQTMAATPRMLLYFYLNDLDKAGHLSGCGSRAWEEALEEVDSCVRRLDAQLPGGTLVLVTGDHGMVDIPEHRRIDFGAEADLIEGVRHTAGEPRMVHLHVEDPARDGAVQRVIDRWRERFGSQAWVMTRKEAVEAGFFGDVREEVLPRIGDILVAVHGEIALYDGRRVRPTAFSMVGQHGSLTKAERLVPLVVFRAGGPTKAKRRRRG
ncbi:alkaline phosphatase family protein [Sinomonas sp. ASV322]|uniref:alkaline phosphatase family protein n=1 Tax=Sinomonas sp. ASV322 TaxID=3041920 RepID=UPI0027DE5193|nr:alkaline phosphatase family protein [Sinomonas sp. ASV322]MDQ4500863.1 alkaline phosphatase family protein [Sinomonas sp. ASV322]